MAFCVGEVEANKPKVLCSNALGQTSVGAGRDFFWGRRSGHARVYEGWRCIMARC